MVKNRVKDSLSSGKRRIRTDSSSEPKRVPPCSSKGISRFSPYQNPHLRSKGRTLKKSFRTSSGGPDSEITKPLRSEIESTKPCHIPRAPDEETNRARSEIRSVMSLLSKSRVSSSEICRMTGVLLDSLIRDAKAFSGQNDF